MIKFPPEDRNELDYSYLGKSSMKDAFLHIPTVLPSDGDKKWFWRREWMSRRKYSKYIFAIFQPLKKVVSLPPPSVIMLTTNLITLRGAMDKAVPYCLMLRLPINGPAQLNFADTSIYFDHLGDDLRYIQALLPRSIRIVKQKASTWELVSTQRQ